MNTRLTYEELFPEKLPTAVQFRIRDTIRFLEDGPKLTWDKKIADCGEVNPVKLAVEDHFSIPIHSLDWNFDYVTPLEVGYMRFDVIMCFEVLEHLFNPLLFLEELSSMLNPRGIIYLSTPYQVPQIIKAKHHYHEIPTDRLMWLLEAAGLKVVRQGKVTIAGKLTEHIHGIRPLLRYFQHSRIYQLEIR